MSGVEICARIERKKQKRKITDPHGGAENMLEEDEGKMNTESLK